MQNDLLGPHQYRRNSVVAASMFGSTAFFSGKVADDKVGDFFVKDLKKSGVDFHQVGPSSGVTGKCLVMVTPDAERSMNTNLGIEPSNVGDRIIKCRGWNHQM